MHNAQLALDASIISKSGTFGVEKPAYAGFLGCAWVVSVKQREQPKINLNNCFYFSCKLGDGTVFEKKMRIGGSMSMSSVLDAKQR